MIRVRRVQALALVIVFLLGGGLASAGRAQAAPSGADVALGLPGACPDKARLLFLRNPRGGAIGRWVTVEGPDFGTDQFQARPGIAAHAVHPNDPRRLIASDGLKIHVSSDGGCRWEQVEEVRSAVRLNLSGELVVEEKIRQIEMVGGGGGTRAWAFLAPVQDGVGPIRVLVSDDRGRTWQERSAGLPSAHSRFDSSSVDCGVGDCVSGRMAVAESDPDVAYIVVNRQTSADFYRTTDGGRSWVNVPNLQNLSTQGYFGFEVDPRDANRVWVVSQGILMSSRDGGSTWSNPSGRPTSAYGLHLGGGPGPTAVTTFEQQGVRSFSASFSSRDDGASFQRQEFAENLSGRLSIAQGGDPREMVLSTDAPDAALRFDAEARRFQSIGLQQLGDLNAPEADRTAKPAYWFRTFADLAIFVPGAPPPAAVPPPPPPRPDFPPLPGAELEAERVPGDLVPAQVDDDLGAEGSKTYDFRLDLPALPTPVDIYFLMDTSGSMSGAHQGLREGINRIVKELAASKIDAWYGLGVFPARSIFYDRVIPVGPPGEDLQDALRSLTTDGRTNEIHPTALYQAVTGAGQEDAGIPAGRDARFRANALKIIVHATDEPYGDDPGGPSREDAADSLVAAGVKHVGLDLSEGAAIPEAGDVVSATKPDHDFMADETGTYAPEEGVDCNGDGRLELQEGEPLTCPIDRRIDRTAIAPAIIAAIRAVRDETAVDMTVVGAGGLEIEPLVPRHAPVNLKVANRLPFPVKFTCPPEMTGRVAEVRLLARVRGAPSGEALARIGCGAPAPVIRPAKPRPLAAAVPVVVAPPQLVPNLEPGLSPLQQPAPSQVAAPSAQPGIAAQPGELQTAKQRASNGVPPPPDPGQNSEPATTGTLAAGAALAAGTGAWAARRERAQVKAGRRA